MSWTFTADDGEQVHYDVPPQVARLEAELAKKDAMLQEAREKWSTRAFERDRYHQQLAALRECCQVLVDAGWIELGSEFIDSKEWKAYKRLATALQEKKE